VPAKSRVYIDASHSADLKQCRGNVPLGSVVGADRAVHPGITVYGVPMGCPSYITTILAGECVEIAGDHRQLPNMKRDITGDLYACRFAMLDDEHAAMARESRLRQL
jgi:hypothetical protein